MNISEARADIAAALTGIDGLSVHDYVPSKMVAPAAVLLPLDPYITKGVTIGELQVNMKVRLFVSTRDTNAVVSKELDELIESVLVALEPYGAKTASRPGIDKESYDGIYLISEIPIITYTKEVN